VAVVAITTTTTTTTTTSPSATEPLSHHHHPAPGDTGHGHGPLAAPAPPPLPLPAAQLIRNPQVPSCRYRKPQATGRQKRNKMPFLQKLLCCWVVSGLFLLPAW
jgi:hypothetical protein